MYGSTAILLESMLIKSIIRLEIMVAAADLLAKLDIRGGGLF